ncbi:MAG: 4-(cytidine 5'-diphospho)-2-C-methyl-D-erythritol kinase [Prevotella sp.]
MIIHPIAKINLGLNVVGKRSDGYHNLETVFYPIEIHDTLQVNEMEEGFPSSVDCDLKVTNADLECDEQSNLVVKAYRQLAKMYPMPKVFAHLHKVIPSQAGLGGGSSDGAFMIRALAEMLRLPITETEMIFHASKLGADCPFFIQAKPVYATGIGEKMTPIELSLKGYHLIVVRPNVAISTAQAFSLIEPKPTQKTCREIVLQPIETWRDELTNDFEQSAFSFYPEIRDIKELLYKGGAVYASMSGSGSSVYGIFDTKVDLSKWFEGMFYKQIDL